MLRCHTQSVPGCRRRVGLEVVLLSVLEASTDPSSLEFLKLSVLTYLDGKHPSASDIAVNLMTSLVSELHGSKIKKISEFFKLCLFDLLGILSQDFLSDNRFCLWLFLAILSKFKLIVKPLTSYEPKSGAPLSLGPIGTKTVPSTSTK